MKNIIKTVLFGKDIVSSFIALLIIASIVLGCNCGKNLGNLSNSGSSSNSSSDTPFGDSDSGDMPDDALLKALVKSTTASFANAISTEDFSTLYNDASEDFKKTYTQDQMKDVFKEFIQKKKQILPILAKAISMQPEFPAKPYIRTESGFSILVANGKYATKPVPMQFEYEYVKRGGTWKMLKLIVRLV